MTNGSAKFLSDHRRRRKRKGSVRVEVQVRREDAAFVLLGKRFGSQPARGLKDLLAAAPLDDIDLERRDDLGRSVDL